MGQNLNSLFQCSFLFCSTLLPKIWKFKLILHLIKKRHVIQKDIENPHNPRSKNVWWSDKSDEQKTGQVELSCKYFLASYTHQSAVFLTFVFSGAMAKWLRRWIPNPGGSRAQNHWVAPRSTQPFILPRSIKWVSVISGNWMVKSKLPPRSGCGLETVEPYP